MLKVDVELGEGGQLALVALASLDRAGGQCATNNCWAIWSKELYLAKQLKVGNFKIGTFWALLNILSSKFRTLFEVLHFQIDDFFAKTPH